MQKSLVWQHPPIQAEGKRRQGNNGSSEPKYPSLARAELAMHSAMVADYLARTRDGDRGKAEEAEAAATVATTSPAVDVKVEAPRKSRHTDKRIMLELEPLTQKLYDAVKAVGLPPVRELQVPHTKQFESVREFLRERLGAVVAKVFQNFNKVLSNKTF